MGLSLRPGVCVGRKPVAPLAPFVDGPAAPRLWRSSSLESRVEDMMLLRGVDVGGGVGGVGGVGGLCIYEVTGMWEGRMRNGVVV